MATMPMLIDRLGLRSWILLATAGWALLLWGATLFGLGGRIDEAVFDAGGTPALPAVPVPGAAPAAASGDVAEVSGRPLFAEDRKPHPFRATSSQGSASVLRLTGVLMAGEFAMATFSTDQNASIRLRLNGEAVEGWQLLSLEPRRATVLGPDGAQVLELAVFNGQGGEAPTVLGTSARPAQAGAPRMPDGNRGPAAQASNPGPAAAANPDAAARAGAPSPPASSNNQGPSEEQMQAIRERIRARREQLRQQQQQRPSSAPPGADANR